MKKKLRDLADIRTGYQFRGKVTASDQANVSVIQIKDVDDRLRIHVSDLLPVKVDKPEAYEVNQGDLLFLSRGHRKFAAEVTDPVRDTIATGYFYIVHPKSKVVDPSFLAWSINHSEFQEAMRPFVRGSHIPLISKTDFQDITIRLPPLAVQRRIVELHRLFDRERELTTEIQSKREMLLQAVSRKLMTGQLQIQGDKL
ncbi:restriction endonuclease subunit S [Telmatocola sphagniphila]|uniref:Restriction endonuclease subunit S n=1 Tax=Telmatocola sphagniphila TaxID=1123043 RepID=A0A8E6B2W5_9BACT|nr:restriction endonuclease subunit S [Telmatocola sphagniphila]QVL30294.1 restriction endonuclease subunit S [Telmatocola sphagniphila]